MWRGLGEPIPASRVAGPSPQLARPRRQVPIQTANSSTSSTNSPRTPVVPAVVNTLYRPRYGWSAAGTDRCASRSARRSRRSVTIRSKLSIIVVLDSVGSS